MAPTVADAAADQTADHHAEACEHHQQRHHARCVAAHLGQPRGHIAPPAEDAGVAGEHGDQHHPRAGLFEEPELAGQARIPDRLDARHPRQYQHNRHGGPCRQNAEGQTPGHELGHHRARRHTEHIRHGLTGHHHRDGLRLLALVGQGLGDQRGGAEERAMRQPGDEAPHDEHRRVQRHGAQQVADQRDRHEQQDELLRRHAAAEDQHQRADAHADGIGRDVVARGRDVDAHCRGSLGQDAHHHEFRGAEHERARGQGQDASFHGGSLDIAVVMEKGNHCNQ